MIIEERAATVDESGVILCPQCGANNVHIMAPKPLDAPNEYSKGIVPAMLKAIDLYRVTIASLKEQGFPVAMEVAK